MPLRTSMWTRCWSAVDKKPEIFHEYKAVDKLTVVPEYFNIYPQSFIHENINLCIDNQGFYTN